MGRIIVIIAFFALLAASAATGFPSSVYGEDLPRGLRILDWIVTNLATDRLGSAGGAALFGALGLLVSAVSLLPARSARPRTHRDSKPTTAPAVEAVAPTKRRRALIADKPDEPSSGGTTKGAIQVLLGADPQSSEAQDQRPAETFDYARLLARIAEDNMPPPPPDGPLPEEIVAASRHPIVFRQTVPPPAERGLSFYGGRPAAPLDFEWPRTADAKPLHFIMQWDCRQLAAQDRTGLLPADGVLYFFLDFEWGRGDGFRFVHILGPTSGWAAIDPPDDLGPVHGKEGSWQMAGCTSKVDDPDAYVPRLMPYFPFTPVALEYPAPPPGEDADEDGPTRLFWNDGIACREALLEVQKAEGPAVPLRDLNAPPRAFGRPFEAFPHDFGAIRVLAEKVIKELDKGYFRPSGRTLPSLSDEEKQALFAEWREQAGELYLFACKHDMGEPVPPDVSLQVWEWVTALEPVFAPWFERLVISAVDLSLGIESAALPAIPPEWVAEAARLHTLASEHMRDEYPDWTQPDAAKKHDEKRARGELQKVRDVHAPTPAHMLGPPSYVQGYVEELMDEHILLLELTSGSGPAHHFGDGVLQFLIKPDDLRRRRFDQVTPVISGY